LIGTSFEQKLSVLKENLALIDNRAKNINEQRRICLEQIASLICGETADNDLNNTATNFRLTINTKDLEDLLYICTELLRTPKYAQHLKRLAIIGSEEATPAGSHGKIAYTKNKFNEIAFEHFSTKIKGAKSHYASSLADACETLNNGECEFCILPIRNSVDGKLFGFYSMLDRYELKICAVCDIDSQDDANSVRYALVGKSCIEPLDSKTKDAKYIFEFSLLAENGMFIEDLLRIARASRATTVSIDSRPVEYDIQLYKFIFCFRVNGADSLLLRTMLNFYYDTYSPIGIYLDN
jgi:hypothetical protein